VTVLAVVAALAIPHGALADGSDDDDQFGEVEFHGVIEALPDPGPVGDWTVSGRTVRVTDATELEADQEGDCNDDDQGEDNDNQGEDEGDDDNSGPGGGDEGENEGDEPECDETATFAVGDDVEVEGVAEADGSITATEIEADDEGENEDGDDQGDDNDGKVVLRGSAQRIVHTASHVGVWRVSSHPVRVLKSTKIVRNGRTLHWGAHLRVTGKWFAGGTIRATRIAIVR
jgi:hypothetical protein